MINLDPQVISDMFKNIQNWMTEHIFVQANLIELLVILFLYAISVYANRRIQPFIEQGLRKYLQNYRYILNFLNASIQQFTSLNLIILLWVASIVFGQLSVSSILLKPVITLLLVWVVIKIISTVVLDRYWAKTISVLAWSIAALSILDLLGPMIEFLDKVGFDLGEIHISVLSVTKAVIILLVALKIAKWIGSYADSQISKLSQLTPSAHVLISKSISAVVYFTITLIVLDSVGVDLTALAVFGGALGVGIGFGLQKVASNLLSGIILLSDRSIKPGDVVQIGSVYGWISSLKSRYVSVVTRDGHEYLIPNEDLITQQVINWSYSDTRIRIKIPFGVSYKSDPHQVKDLVVEAMNDVPRVLKSPPPICLLTGFGDNSVDMELRIWIDDPKNGTANVQSDALYRVWDTLKEHDIEIPYPQRDLHIRSGLNFDSRDKEDK